MKRTLLHVTDMQTANYVMNKLSWLLKDYRFRYIIEPAGTAGFCNLSVTAPNDKPIDGHQMELLFYFASHYETFYQQFKPATDGERKKAS